MARDEIATRFRVSADRLHVIHNGVDSERFRPGAPAAEERRALAGVTPASGPVWLFAGSGWRRKGADTAIAALARSDNRDARLWLVGRDRPAPWRALARRNGVADRVDFLGQRADMDRVYRASDALLLPSRYDAFANVCVEAAASGIPVVTSATNGSSELMHRCGRVVDDPEDVDAFANAIDQLGDPARRRELGSRGREMALALTWGKHVERLRALYRLARSRRAPSGVRDRSGGKPATVRSRR